MNHIFSLSIPMPFQVNKRIFNISQIKRKLRLNISGTFSIITLVTIVTIFVISIIQVGLFAKEFYLIKSYELKINKISKENEGLEVVFSKLNSLSNIENYLSDENFVKVTKAKYIPILESTVAKLNK